MLLSILSFLTLSSCGGSAGSGTTPVAVAAPGSVDPGGTAVGGDDWTSYAHDVRRTGLQSQNVGITAANVSKLSLRWKFTATDSIYASPVAFGGLLVVTTANRGLVYALDVKSGKVVWQRDLGGQIRLTPTIADGQIFVGTHLFTTDAAGDYYHPAPSTFYSLDLLTGAVRWQASLAGPARSAPVVAGGRVYIGIAGGDPPVCIPGGVTALDESSGAVVWTWHVNSVTNQGGAVWAPLSFDGTNIIVGTGNTCDSPVTTANSVVALDASSGRLVWSFLAQANSLEDDDTGGGSLLVADRVYAINKNGSFYAIDANRGEQMYAKLLNPNDGYGGWATPTTDGSTILMSGGAFFATPPTARVRSTRSFYSVRRRGEAAATVAGTGSLFALDLSGNVKWTLATKTPIVSYVAIASGLAIGNIDGSLVALDMATGQRRWSYALADDAQGGPVVVPSGVYTADDSGNVYAFSNTTIANATALARRSARQVPSTW